MESLQGKFLIATPQMPDPRFARQVIYICSHTEEGALGLAINQPCQYSLDEILRTAQIDISCDVGSWPRIYTGGPVEPDTAFFLYSSDYIADQYLEVSDGVHISRDPGILNDISRGVGPKNYLFVLGYAGWSPGQLDAELATNGWLALPGGRDILFETLDHLKWEKAAEKYGIDIALFNDEVGRA